MKQIPLTGIRGRGKFALVDDEDYEKCIQYSWNMNQDGYVQSEIHYKAIRLHQYVFNTNTEIDHINRNKLDCRKENLREATRSQNMGNISKINQNATSKYKGVSFKKANNKWVAQIRINNKKTYIGIYSDEIAAAKAYDEAAKKHFGEFAYLNFPNNKD